MPTPYLKPALTFAQQLKQLKDRGLNIEHDDKALFLLENISYFRFSGYWYPLLNTPKSSHIFKSGASFNQGFSLYCFDRELRLLLHSEIEKIEIALRAKMIYHLSFQDPFWYTKPSYFSNTQRHTDTLKKLSDEFKRSNEDFIKSFKNKYNDRLPPSWMMLEVSSFGNLSFLYENLRYGKTRRQIAESFGLDTKTFTSWIHAIGYIRNLCAHHSRFWNKKLSIAPILPYNPINQWLLTTYTTNTMTGSVNLINNRAYMILSITLYLLNVINPNHTFRNKVMELLKKYPNIDTAAMGFTTDWRNEPLWLNFPLIPTAI